MKITRIILIIAISGFLVLKQIHGVEENLYNKPYLQYDKYGLKAVNCMRCNVQIKTRSQRLVRLNDTKEIYVEFFKTLSNFIAVPVLLDNGSFTNILMCKDCKKVYQLTKEEKLGMANQLKNGWILEAKGLKRSLKEIRAIVERTENLEVIKNYNFKE